MDLDEYRQHSRDNWDRFASNWAAEREFLNRGTSAVAQAMVTGVNVSPGETVLEIAAGTGEAGFALSERLGGDCTVVSTDFAPGMVDASRSRAEELGLDNFEFRLLDAESMDLEDDSFDGVLCRFGYMLMADPQAAMRETRRVLRDGRRVAFAVWGQPDKNLWAAIPGMTLAGLGHMPPPEPGAPGIFALGDPDRIRELVTGAGFGEPRIEQVPVEWGYNDVDEHWARTLKLAAPIADAVERLDPDERERVRATVAERVGEALEGDGIEGLVHVVVAE